MGTYVSGCRCVTILLPPGTSISSGCTRLLVRCAQRHCGAAPWGSVYAEAFPGSGATGSLILARPAECLHIGIADSVFPLIHKYFTD